MLGLDHIFKTQAWKRITFSIDGSDIEDMQISQDINLPSKVRMEITGDSARDILIALAGYDPNPWGKDLPKPVDHQDEALAAARRDAAHEKKRADLAEARARALEDDIEDHRGEIDALNAELEATKKPKLGSGGMIYAIDPAGNPITGGLKSMFPDIRAKRGGFDWNSLPAPEPITLPDYAQADIDMMKTFGRYSAEIKLTNVDQSLLDTLMGKDTTS